MGYSAGTFSNILGLVSRFLFDGKNFGLCVDGDPGGLWFMIKHMKLGDQFNKKYTDVIVKFDLQKKIVVLVRTDVQLKSESKVCSYFLQRCTFMPGWRRACPSVAQYLFGGKFEHVLVLLSFIANPELCGVGGCDKRLRYRDFFTDFME